MRRLSLSITMCLALFAGAVAGPDALAADAVSPEVAQRLLKVQKLETQADKQPELADAYWDLAAQYMAGGQYADAEKYLRKSYEIEKSLQRPKSMVVERALNPLVDVATNIGTALMLQGRLEEAIKQYDEASKLAAQSGNGDELAAIQNNIANSFLQINRLEESKAAALKGLTGAEKFASIRSKLLHTLAVISMRTNHFSEALKYAEESYSEAAKVDDALAGVALVFVGDVQNRMGLCDASMKTYEQVVSQFDKQIFPDVAAAAEIAMAKNYYERRLIPAAITHYERAVAYVAEDKESQELLIDCLINMGMSYSDIEKFDEAEKYHRKAADLARARGNKAREVEALMQLSEDQLIRGKAEPALALLAQCSDILDKSRLNSKYRADLCVAYAKCYKSLREKEPAIRMTQDAIKLYRESQNPLLEALSYTTLATIYLDFGNPEKIEELQEQSRALYSALPARDSAAFDYNLAQAKLMQRKFEEAVPIYESALNKIKDSGDIGLQSALYRGIGLAYYYMGDYNRSLECYQKALALSKDSGSLDTQWSCNLGAAKALKGLKRYEEAEPFLNKAMALVEQERSAMTRDNFKTQSMDFRRNCFEEAVDLYVLTNRPYDALTISERGKARSFLDLLTNRTQRQVVPVVSAKVSAAPVLVALASNLDSGTRGLQVTKKDAVVDDFVDESAITPVNAEAPSAAEIKELVSRSQSTCIEYMVQQDKLYTWVIAPGGEIKAPPPVFDHGKLRQDVDRLTHLINERASTPVEVAVIGKERQQILRRLYESLIKPVEKFLPADRDAVVTIIPHDFLFRIPFAALQAPDGSYLVEQHTLSYAPAIGVFRATQKLREETAGRERRLLAFGNPITRENAALGALPHAEKEAKSIARLYGPDKSMVEVGAAATKERLNELVGQASEVHLATHGIVDEEHPMRSLVVLAPTATDYGALSVKDIILMKNLKARLVVLSACQTGRGKITGDGVVGLSRAFIIAGTPSVLVSQWNVDDLMTEFQMARFYDRYPHGQEKARALRDAQIATIRFMENVPDGETLTPDPMKVRANPRLWAAFQLIGENK